MDLRTEEHNPFPIDEERFVIPGDLHRVSVLPVDISVNTNIFLQQVALHRIVVLYEGEAIEAVLDGGTNRLGCQQGSGGERQQLHGVQTRRILSLGNVTDSRWSCHLN